MGTFTLSKTNRLYWLGRYVERTIIAIELMEKAYDVSLDGPAFDYAEYCNRLNIPADYEDVETFISQYLFSPDDPNSAASSLNMAFDNAVVLRETLGSMTLSYLQMAKNVMESAQISMAPVLDLQMVRDYLMAFKGCVDDLLSDHDSRMIVKIGINVEQIDMRLRLEQRPDEVEHRLKRLANRLERTHMRRDGKYVRILLTLIPDPQPIANKEILLECLENLFPDA